MNIVSYANCIEIVSESVAQYTIMNFLDMKECGLTLSNEKLTEFFGNDFVERRNEMYKLFKNR